MIKKKKLIISLLVIFIFLLSSFLILTACREETAYCELPYVNSLYISANSIFNTYVSLCGSDVIESGIGISSLENPGKVAQADVLKGWASGIMVVDEFAYVANGENGFAIINIKDVNNPRLEGKIDTPGYANALFVSGDLVFLADGTFGIQVIDIINKQAPSIVGNIDTPGYALDVFVRENTIFVADGKSGLKIYQVPKV